MRVHFEKVMTARAQSFACREFRSRVFTAPFHFHPEYELTAIVSGHGRRFVGDSVEDFAPGDLVLVGANLPHRWASTPPAMGEKGARSFVLQFRRECLGPGFFDMPELAAVHRLLERSSRGLAYGAEVATDVRQRLGRLRHLEGLRRIETFLAILDRLTAVPDRCLVSPGYRMTSGAHDAARIDRVISYVEEHYADDTLSLDDVARMAALTPSAFSRFFSHATGRTFVHFVNDVRLSHACRLLVETDRSVAEICFACGFGAASNFHARFREAKATSPLGFREMFRASEPPMPARFTAIQSEPAVSR